VLYCGSIVNDMTGTDLRLTRIAMGVETADLQKAMGYKSPASISHIETRGKVRQDTAKRYLEALATFGTVPTVTVERAA
jgi:uncharacterized protein YjbK